MSKVKSFRFSDSDIKRIELIESKLGVSFGSLIKNYLEDVYFHVSGIDCRSRCYYVVDYDSEIYSPFYSSEVDAYLDLVNDISSEWSLDSCVECCYGSTGSSLFDVKQSLDFS